MTAQPSARDRLSHLREELAYIEIPPCPNNPYMYIEEWIAEATPVIRIDWPIVFDDFNNIVTVNNWTSISLAISAGYKTESAPYQQAWEKDAKKAEELRHKILRFLDGLISLSSNQIETSPLTNEPVRMYFGDNASVENLCISSTIKNSYNNIESAEVSDELKEALRNLAKAVKAMINKMPMESAEQVARDLATLTTEASSKSPRSEWYQLSIEGLKKAAKDIGEIGEPVLKLAHTVLELLVLKL